MIHHISLRFFKFFSFFSFSCSSDWIISIVLYSSLLILSLTAQICCWAAIANCSHQLFLFSTSEFLFYKIFSELFFNNFYFLIDNTLLVRHCIVLVLSFSHGFLIIFIVANLKSCVVRSWSGLPQGLFLLISPSPHLGMVSIFLCICMYHFSCCWNWTFK